MLDDDKGGAGKDTGGNDSLPMPPRPIQHTEGKNPNDTRQITGQRKPGGGLEKGK